MPYHIRSRVMLDRAKEVEMVHIEPDRTNWHKFCQEPQLTKAEFAKWHEMASVIKKNDALYDFIAEETDAEWTMFMQERVSTDSWSALVERADIRRRLKRAEIKAYQGYQIGRE